MPGTVYRWKVWFISIVKKKRWRKRIKIWNGKKVREIESILKAKSKNNHDWRWCDGEFNACQNNGFQKRW